MSEKSGSLSDRKKLILKAIVEAHIQGGEPVGSKYLSQSVEISASSATIRNEMAELEEMGYLIQPHTSAGRVPSALGYKYYVDALVRKYAETRNEIDEINERLRYKLTEMDQILSEASHLASSFTDYTGIAFKTGTGKARIGRFDAVCPCRYGAPAVLVVAYDAGGVFVYPGGKRDSGAEDASIVATHMMLAAKNAGIDSCWLNFLDPEKLAEALGLPENEKVVMALDLGYPEEGTGPLANHFSRKPLEDTVKYL